MNKIKLPKTRIPIEDIETKTDLVKACLSVACYCRKESYNCVDCALDSLENLKLYKKQEELCL